MIIIQHLKCKTMNHLESKHATNNSYAFLAPAVVSIRTEARVEIFLLAAALSECLVRVNSRLAIPGPATRCRFQITFDQVRLGVAAGVLVADSDHHDASLRVCAPWPLKPPAQAVTGLNAALALAGPGPGPGTVTLRCRCCRGRGGLHWQFTGKTQSR